MKVHPKILAVHTAARALTRSIEAREQLEARCRVELPAGALSRAQAKGMLTTVLDQEIMAFNELLGAVYDEAVLDLVSAGSVH